MGNPGLAIAVKNCGMMPGKIGPVVFSRSGNAVARYCMASFLRLPIPLEDATNFLAQQNQDSIIAIDPIYTPPEITRIIQQANIKNDFRNYCKALVFCRYLTFRNGLWLKGFIPEFRSSESPIANPYSFSQSDLIHLTGEDFIPQELIARAIFINCYFEDGQPLDAAGYLPLISHLTSYLRAKAGERSLS